MQRTLPLFVRFLSKFVLDIMPAALASLIGGFLFTQYQLAPKPAEQKLAAQQIVLAQQAEHVLKIVADDHALLKEFVREGRPQARPRDPEPETPVTEAEAPQAAELRPAEPPAVPSPPRRPSTAEKVASQKAAAAPKTAPAEKPVAAPLQVVNAKPGTEPLPIAPASEPDRAPLTGLVVKVADTATSAITAIPKATLTVGGRLIDATTGTLAAVRDTIRDVF